MAAFYATMAQSYVTNPDNSRLYCGSWQAGQLLPPKIKRTQEVKCKTQKVFLNCAQALSLFSVTGSPTFSYKPMASGLNKALTNCRMVSGMQNSIFQLFIGGPFWRRVILRMETLSLKKNSKKRSLCGMYCQDLTTEHMHWKHMS